jgi:hypothetical protein
MAFENTDVLELNFLGKKLTSIQCYNIKDKYEVFNPNTLAVIDGGVELTFDVHKLVIGWNAELELFDVVTTSIEPLLGDLDHHPIDSAELPIGQVLIGSKLISMDTKWNWFQNLDDKSKPVGQKQHILKEVIFTFQTGHMLQLATIQYTIENKNLSKAQYDSQGELLLAYDQIIEIADVD